MAEAIAVEGCSRCKSPSVIHQAYSGQHLCGKHLSASIRKRTSKELRQQLRLPKDARHADGSPYRILVAISGGKDSAVLLTMICLLYTSPSPRDRSLSRMPSSA